MMKLPLRPYQAEALDKLLARPDRRLILAHGVGAGKTLTSIAAADALDAKRVLVVASALARPVWKSQFAQWGAERYLAHSIKWGRANKSLTKKAQVEREAAYAAPVQVVSYALLKEMDPQPRQLVIFDEAHNLRNPLSKQSRIAKAYMRAHPGLPALLLTATPIPTNLDNLWNLVDTLFPAFLGKAARTGDVSWEFRSAFMHPHVNDYGTVYRGAREERLPALKAKLEPVMHVVTEERFAQHLPPLRAEILRIDEKRTPVDVASEWVEEQRDLNRQHVGVFCYTHETANALRQALEGRGYAIFHVTGLLSPEARARILAQAATCPAALVIATMESVRESISLSFLKDALVMEWRTSPGSATQFLGRFARADATSQAPTLVKYLSFQDDEERAQKLKERIDAVAALVKQDAKSEKLAAIFSARILTEEERERLLDACVASYRPKNSAWKDADDD